MMRKTDFSDYELLRIYEPILRFNRGEVFFPTDVDRYVQACSLWVNHADGRVEKLLGEGQVNLETLGEHRTLDQEDVLYLHFVDDLSFSDITRQVLHGERMFARAIDRGWNPGRGRLARVGYFSRLMDALFSLVLLFRGKVPGATAAVAERKSLQIQSQGQKYVYYGRVFRDAGWIGLQYWYFYHYGDWRTGFTGVNDHESDWETVFVYLYKNLQGELVPRWAVYSSHDFQGSDLRRRWDDREQLDLIGNHPVVYVGAGSHASYFRPGEYVIEADIPWIERIVHPWLHFKARINQIFGLRTNPIADRRNLLKIPFVEYARGDGASIGQGQEHEWEAVLLDPLPTWASNYRGLWGLYGRGSISGEIAPGGPLFNRNGTPRLAWYDPLAFSGLDRTPTPPVELAWLIKRRQEIEPRQDELEHAIRLKMDELQKVSAESTALADYPSLNNEARKISLQMERLESEISGYRREYSQNKILSLALDHRIMMIQNGEDDPPQAHIGILQTPNNPDILKFGQVAEIWAAASIGLLLMIFVSILIFVPQRIPVGITILVLAFVLIEALFRGRIRETAALIANVLAVIVAFLLLIAYFKEIIIGVLLIGAIFLTWDNLREVIQIRPRRRKKSQY